MSTETFTNVLSTPLHSRMDPASESLDDLVDRHVQDLARYRDWRHGQCMLTGIGEFLTRSLTSLSDLGEGVVNGEHIKQITKNTLQELENDDEVADLRCIENMNDKHALLKLMQTELSNTATRIQKLWEERPTSLMHDSDASDDSTLMEYHDSDGFVASSLLQSPQLNDKLRFACDRTPKLAQPYMSFKQRSARRSSSETDDMSTNHPFDNGAYDRTVLNARGKGAYTCPHGLDCKKGGVSPSGDMVVFERNCAFRAHLQKHEKSFKCEIAGCPNKSGFARIDQLQRHQRTVKHTAKA